MLQVLVQHRVVGDVVVNCASWALGSLLVQQQPHDLDEVTARGELFDRVAGVTQDALLAVEEGDGALAGAGVRVAGVEGDVARLRAELRDVDRALAFGADHDREIPALVADPQLGLLRTVRGGLVGHGDLLVRSGADASARTGFRTGLGFSSSFRGPPFF
jgi:hypothetical protein